MRALLNTVGCLLIQIFVINPSPLFFILSSLLELKRSPSLNTIQYSFRNNIHMEYLYTEASLYVKLPEDWILTLNDTVQQTTEISMF